jgi:hypothetical protein
MALGVVVFYLFVAAADIWKERGEHARALSAGGKAAHEPPDLDASGPGLSQAEFGRRLPDLLDRFAEIDTDRSGRVTTDELQAYWRGAAPPPGKR